MRAHLLSTVTRRITRTERAQEQRRLEAERRERDASLRETGGSTLDTLIDEARRRPDIANVIESGAQPVNSGRTSNQHPHTPSS
eukprot:3171568-Prymnesium_polylepis.1